MKRHLCAFAGRHLPTSIRDESTQRRSAVAANCQSVVMSQPRGRPAGATRDEVLAAAADRFANGVRVSFSSLSTDLGVSRPTLYRWFGSRQGLLGEVIAAGFVSFHEACRRRAPHVGLAKALVRLAHDLSRAKPVPHFLETEREVALRVLTSNDGLVQPHTVALTAALIQEETEAGRCRPATDAQTVAYAITRLVEAFLYNDAITGLPTDLNRLLPLLEALLRPQPAPFVDSQGKV